MKKYLSILAMTQLIVLNSCIGRSNQNKMSGDEADRPKIVNIINFIRLCEPRRESYTEEVLYETVLEQVRMMQQYKLGGTFLLQYDALMDPRYQELLKDLPADKFEIGAWWEIPQPLVENAGLTWRGRYPWDWHANVGFATGYSPAEREKLADIYMEDFKRIFGYYPKSVGSWFIDAHTLNYLHQKYGIIASCNCKDQVGTDGYTLWGGYWNQGYYPSKKNAYIPAQNETSQIPVPVFRMLGSDPVRQYDLGLGSQRQRVISLEPVYQNGGGDSAWVDWYFSQFTEGECMAYAYVQAGQENSFTWNRMSEGFKIQLQLIDRLRNENKLIVETLSETGQWFRENFKTTPATSVTVMKDLGGSNLKTVWFNSRFYRINLLWEDNTLRFRDIHMFNEEFSSDYVDARGTSTKCDYFTLPVVDGFHWSTASDVAGLRFKTVVNGNEILLEGGTPLINDSIDGKLIITWPLKSPGSTLVIDIDENKTEIRMEGDNTVPWHLDLTTAENAQLPFERILPTQVVCQFRGMDYDLLAVNGIFSKPGNGIDLRMIPEDNIISLDFTRRNITD